MPILLSPETNTLGSYANAGAAISPIFAFFLADLKSS
jgi:hypothetical protein